MSAGLDWNENLSITDASHSEMRMLSSADQYRYVLEQPVAAPGGQVWNYNSGGTLLIEAVIAKAAGGALDDVASECRKRVHRRLSGCPSTRFGM
jgi:CubicO group peptidase (beta-lactamase class C family)